MEGSKTFPSVIERYYSQNFATDVSGPGEDQFVYTHTNSLIVVGLAPYHPVVQQAKQVVSVTFQSDQVDLTKNVVKGSKKKGGAKLRPLDNLALITCVDGSEYQTKCCVSASLLEVNPQLATNPNLLVAKPSTQGYLAIFQPLSDDGNHQKVPLLSQEEYHKLRNDEGMDPKSVPALNL